MGDVKGSREICPVKCRSPLRAKDGGDVISKPLVGGVDESVYGAMSAEIRPTASKMNGVASVIVSKTSVPFP